MADRRETAFQAWAKFLNPEELRKNLVQASIFLTAYEFLVQALVEHLEEFYSVGFNTDGLILGPNYRLKVLALHPMPFFASALWFRNAEALTDDDIAQIREIREHRNFVAHHIPDILSDVTANNRPDLLRAIADIVGRIDNWWFREVEVPTDPDLDIDPADLSGVVSVRTAVLDLLIQVSDGDDAALKSMYGELMKSRGQS